MLMPKRQILCYQPHDREEPWLVHMSLPLRHTPHDTDKETNANKWKQIQDTHIAKEAK